MLQDISYTTKCMIAYIPTSLLALLYGFEAELSTVFKHLGFAAPYLALMQGIDYIFEQPLLAIVFICSLVAIPLLLANL